QLFPAGFPRAPALLAHAGLERVAGLALARFRDLRAALRPALGALLRLGFALRGVLRLRAQLAAHALAAFGAALALAGLARLEVGGAHLLHALLAGLGVLGLRAVEAARLGLGFALGRLGEGGAGGEQDGAEEGEVS